MKNTLMRTHENINQAITIYSDTIFKVALSYTKNRDTAEDILQDVLIKYMTDSTDFESEVHKKAWFIRVTINECNRFYRSLWNSRKITLKDIYPFQEPDKHDVFYAVMELPTKYRLLIHLFYYEELSVSQIGTILNLNENTVRSRLHRGRKILKTILEVEYEYGSV